MIKTYSPKASEVTRDWHVLDATDQILGRLATRAAMYLRGKHKPTYAPHLDMGDHVVIVNAAKIRVTGQKIKQKVYYRHSGYPGGLKSRTLEQQLQKFPERVIESAVRGMLPKTALGKAMFGKLHVYAGPSHPHRGQVEPGDARRPKAEAGTPTPTPTASPRTPQAPVAEAPAREAPTAEAAATAAPAEGAPVLDETAAPPAAETEREETAPTKTQKEQSA